MATGSATTEHQGCAVWQVPIKMWERVYGSELTRRGSGDHEQRPKGVWGGKQ